MVAIAVEVAVSVVMLLYGGVRSWLRLTYRSIGKQPEVQAEVRESPDKTHQIAKEGNSKVQNLRLTCGPRTDTSVRCGVACGFIGLCTGARLSGF